MPNRKIAISRDMLLELYYKQKLSYTEIARMLFCDPITIKNRFREFGLKPRSLSEAIKGRRQTPEWKEKRISQLRGKPRSQATKDKISLAAMGRPSPFKGLRKATHPEIVVWGVSGSRHWAWKGGVSPINKRIRVSSEYKVWRDHVFQRDNYTCQSCGKRGGWLEADHIFSFADYPQLRFDISNGRTLCRPCHRKVTSRQARQRARGEAS